MNLGAIIVIAPGSKVRIGDDIPAFVTAVSINATGRVLYNVSWWNGRMHEEKWLECFELHRTEETKTTKIGFHAND